MKSDSKENRLLGDLFAEAEQDYRCSESSKNLALAAYRSARSRRKWMRGALVLTSAALAIFFLPFRGRTIQWIAPVAVNAPAPSSASRIADHAGPKIISEQELLALFPSNACFIAELNGRKTLVFRDPALAAEVLR